MTAHERIEILGKALLSLAVYLTFIGIALV